MELPKNYILERKNIKHARIRVSENLTVRILVPNVFDKNDIQSLLEKKQKWIEKNLANFRKKTEIIKLYDNHILLFGNKYTYCNSPEHGNKVIINQESKTIQSKIDLLDNENQLKWYKRFAKEYLIARVSEIAKKQKFKYNKIFIRNQRTKWGNCSADKNLSFNWRIIKTPYFVIDYLILHELLHTRTMNHTNKFWTELKIIYPDYQEAVKWLDKYGNGL